MAEASWTGRLAALVVCAGTAIGCGDDGADGGGGTGPSGGAGGAADEVAGCDGARLLASSEDTSLRGPWTVGARTLSIDGLTVEAWYPAASGSANTAPRVYDVRDWLPASELGKISDADAPLQTCDCFADLPVDTTRGPYPVVVF